MADVYKFKISLCELENLIWRDIEITSVSTVAKLGYSILAAFRGVANHLFNIQFNGKRFELMFEEDDFYGEPAVDPTISKLSSLKLQVGDKLTMVYDYGAGWEFDIELLSITEMKRGTGTHYPYVTDGKGKGIIEDTSPYDLVRMIEEADKNGAIPHVLDLDSGEEIPWDYNSFDLDNCNALLKGNVCQIQNAYEYE